jgi:transcriptional regulator of acetoin/glycerol metabolism
MKEVVKIFDQFGDPRPIEVIIAEATEAVIAHCMGNQTLAAKSLGISRSTLWRRLKRGGQNADH